MRIGFLTDGKLCDFQKGNQVSRADLFCLSFGCIGEVNYEKEVRGETGELEEVALFSRSFNCVVAAGCYTNAKGIKRKSVVVAQKGKILGISDMTTCFDDDNYKCGSGVRVYDTVAGKLGVLVCQDLYFPELVKSLTLCGSEKILVFFENMGDSLEQVLLRADAFCYGSPMILCARGYAQMADIDGKLAFGSPQSVSYFTPKPYKEYHLVETRLRGFYKPQEMF